MDTFDRHDRASIHLLLRIFAAAMGAGLVVLLVLARSLSPDERGHGTHEQLGLPPCTFYVIYGRPCPACGMTTAWAWTMRGNVVRALAANAGGTLLAVLSLAAAPWLLISAVRGRWLGGVPSDRMTVAVSVTVSLVTAAQWLWRIL